MQIFDNVSLKEFNTFGIDATARWFGRFDSLDELKTLPKDITPKFVLGGGSNILLTGNIDGLVIKNEIAGIHQIAEDDTAVYIKSGAGVNWHHFVMYCVEYNLGGIENLSLIPGCVGASPMQNIGAYGVEIKDSFYQLEAWHIQDKAVVQFGLEECGFAYRESVFKNKYRGQFVILNVIFKLDKAPVIHTSYGAIVQELERMGIGEPTIKDVSDAVINIRKSKLPDPALIGNAGSFFKNPEISATQYNSLQYRMPGIVGYPLENSRVKLAAGWMIEQCGWKGYRKGDAGIHVNQALVLVNYGNAVGREILDLSAEIIQSVNERFGVTLEREVNLV